MSNIDALTQAGLLVKQTKEIDLGEYAEQFKGTKLAVWVNAPAVIDDWIVRADEKETDLDSRRKIVRTLYELNADAMRVLDDSLMLWMYQRGIKEYTDYHTELRKNSNGG